VNQKLAIIAKLVEPSGYLRGLIVDDRHGLMLSCEAIS
jgi:hypothetical protein